MKKKGADPSITRFPTPLNPKAKARTQKEKIDYISIRFKEIMECLGLDLKDDSLQDTPLRVAKMFVNEIFSGLDNGNFPDINFFEEQIHHEHRANTVLVKVSFTSFCEHHFVPFTGFAYVSYIPNKKLIGLSKIPRIVKYFARRPQLQERLTAQIADSLSLLLDTENIAVSIIAEHFCMIARGIEDEQSHTVTNVLRGEFDYNDQIRREFFEGINRKLES